jgi:hypothetical protein
LPGVAAGPISKKHYLKQRIAAANDGAALIVDAGVFRRSRMALLHFGRAAGTIIPGRSHHSPASPVTDIPPASEWG